MSLLKYKLFVLVLLTETLTTFILLSLNALVLPDKIPARYPEGGRDFFRPAVPIIKEENTLQLSCLLL